MKRSIYPGKPLLQDACAILIYLAALNIHYPYHIIIVLDLLFLAHGRQLEIVFVAGAGYRTASGQAGSSQKDLDWSR